MVFSGLLFGLLAAASQAASYIFSRSLLAGGGESKRLLVSSQFLLGLISLVAVAATGWWRLLSWRLLEVIAMASLCFVVAQFFFFEALKRMESSRIASLVGLKTLIIAFLTFLFFHKTFRPAQLVALAMTVAAAMLMNCRRRDAGDGEKRSAWNGMGFLFLALVGYSFSDLGVFLTVERVPLESTVMRGIAGTALNNVFILIVFLPLVIKWKIGFAETAKSAAYALSWGAGILFLYICFGFIGAAFGTVVQASRGPMSFFLGILLAAKGYTTLERRLSVGGWVQRGAAAFLMFAAIVLYALSN